MTKHYFYEYNNRKNAKNNSHKLTSKGINIPDETNKKA